MKRIGLWLVVTALLLSLSACRVRLDLSADPVTDDETKSTTTSTRKNDTTGDGTAEGPDNMAIAAFDIYTRAKEREAQYTALEQQYTAKITQNGSVSYTSMRLVARAMSETENELLAQVEMQGQYISGYYKDGVAYYDDGTDKVYLFCDEDAFLKQMGIGEGSAMLEEAFSQAVVVEESDGSATVTCPFEGEAATAFAQDLLGTAIIKRGYSVKQAQYQFEVDAAGNFTRLYQQLSLYSSYGGTLTFSAENRFAALDDDVVLTPPSDLDSYQMTMNAPEW